MNDRGKGRKQPIGNQFSVADGREKGVSKGQDKTDRKETLGAESELLKDDSWEKRRKEILAFCKESRTIFLRRSGRDVLGTVPEKCLRMLRRKQAKLD